MVARYCLHPFAYKSGSYLRTEYCNLSAGFKGIGITVVASNEVLLVRKKLSLGQNIGSIE